jgi:hypothetical protein
VHTQWVCLGEAILLDEGSALHGERSSTGALRA